MVLERQRWKRTGFLSNPAIEQKITYSINIKIKYTRKLSKAGSGN
jgi:hypothetical protein